MTDTRRRIAVVDDEPSVCKALKRLLGTAGFDVQVFPGGEEFLESLRTGEPDCVILDLHMPCLTGFDVQARLAEAHAGLPVVAITGHDSSETRERALAGGAAAYLTKPMSEQTLLEVLGICLAAKRSGLEADRPDQAPTPEPQRRRGEG